MSTEAWARRLAWQRKHPWPGSIVSGLLIGAIVGVTRSWLQGLLIGLVVSVWFRLVVARRATRAPVRTDRIADE